MKSLLSTLSVLLLAAAPMALAGEACCEKTKAAAATCEKTKVAATTCESAKAAECSKAKASECSQVKATSCEKQATLRKTLLTHKGAFQVARR